MLVTPSSSILARERTNRRRLGERKCVIFIKEQNQVDRQRQREGENYE